MSGDSTGLPDSASKRNGRSIWFHIHFWIGWIAAIPIALICFTGAALVFEQNLFRWEHKALYQLDTTGEAMSVAEVLEAYRSSDPPLRVNHLGIPQSPEYSYRPIAPSYTRMAIEGRVASSSIRTPASFPGYRKAFH